MKRKEMYVIPYWNYHTRSFMKNENKSLKLKHFLVMQNPVNHVGCSTG